MNTWQSVRAEVLERIRTREWPPGELIPTEQQLALQMGCARATVNRALRELADTGILERRRKVGTRVTSTHSRKTTLQMAMMRHEIEAQGLDYGYLLTGFSHDLPTAAVRAALQVGAHDQMAVVEAQYSAGNRPHCCEQVWLNPALVPAMDRGDFERQPVHEWLAQHVPLTHGRFAITAQAATPDCARRLDIQPGTPVLMIERLNWSDTLPVSFARQIYPPHHQLISEG